MERLVDWVQLSSGWSRDLSANLVTEAGSLFLTTVVIGGVIKIFEWQKQNGLLYRNLRSIESQLHAAAVDTLGYLAGYDLRLIDDPYMTHLQNVRYALDLSTTGRKNDYVFGIWIALARFHRAAKAEYETESLRTAAVIRAWRIEEEYVTLDHKWNWRKRKLPLFIREVYLALQDFGNEKITYDECLRRLRGKRLAALRWKLVKTQRQYVDPPRI